MLTRSLGNHLAFIAMLVASVTPARALPPGTLKIVEWETSANPAGERNGAPFDIEYFEVPASEVQEYAADKLNPAMRDALVFDRDGKQWVRWIINPDDTEYWHQVQAALKSRSLPSEPRAGRLRGYRTASRSTVIEDKITGAFFSAKMSTNNTGGKWTDKIETGADSERAFDISRYAREIERSSPFKHVVLIDEPLAFKFQSGGLSQGITVRDLGLTRRNDRFYLPAFSAIHESTGSKIARLNGSLDPAMFWQEHYAGALGQALAEFYIRTGLRLDSPHSQNFLIELDKGYRPTGRIAFRDFADSYMDRSYFEHAGQSGKALINKWQSAPTGAPPMVQVGFFHGSGRPSWIDEMESGNWYSSYETGFRRTFERMTGIPLYSLEGRMDAGYATFSVPKHILDRFFPMAGKLQAKGSPSSHPLQGIRLSDAAKQKEIDLGTMLLGGNGRAYRVSGSGSSISHWGKQYDVIDDRGVERTLIVAAEGDPLLDPGAEMDRYRRAKQAGIHVSDILEVDSRAMIKGRFRGESLAWLVDGGKHPSRDWTKSFETLITKAHRAAIDLSRIDLTEIRYDPISKEFILNDLVYLSPGGQKHEFIEKLRAKLRRLVPTFGSNACPGGSIKSALESVL